MKFYKNSLITLLVASSLFSGALANEEISQNDINDQNQMSQAEASKPESMRDFFKRVAKEMGFGSYGAKKEGTKFFFKGEAIVSLKPQDPDFGRAVVNAYEKAIIDLQANYIVDTFGKVSSERLNTLYHDTSTNAKKFEDKVQNENKVERVVDKALSYVEGKLDEGLKEMGKNPEQFNEKQKKSLFKNEFIKSVITTSYGSMSGLVPIKTKLASDKKGNYSVGVVAVISEKTKQIAKDMSLQRKSLIKGNGKDINTIIPQNDEEFLNELGTRLTYDLEGKPTIISYGRWSYNENSSDAYINKMASQTALDQAKAGADAMIIEFMNTKLSFKQDSKTGEIVDQVVTREIDSESGAENLGEEVIKNIVSKISKEVKATASGSVRGISTLTDWEATDKNGINHVGVVRVWSYDTVEAVNNMLKPKSSQASGGNKKTVTTTHESKKVNDANDF